VKDHKKTANGDGNEKIAQSSKKKTGKENMAGIIKRGKKDGI